MAVLSCSSDPEESIRALVAKVFKDLWFPLGKCSMRTFLSHELRLGAHRFPSELHGGHLEVGPQFPCIYRK